jgi:heme/copper-type cytochrome/quinol oxidase subunit 2
MSDPLAPARGVINAIWMAVIVWIVVGVIVWAVWFR